MGQGDLMEYLMDLLKQTQSMLKKFMVVLFEQLNLNQEKLQLLQVAELATTQVLWVGLDQG